RRVRHRRAAARRDLVFAASRGARARPQAGAGDVRRGLPTARPRLRPALAAGALLLAAGLFFSAGCRHEPEEDLIAQAWRADVFSERVGASLIRDGDDPDLVSGWSDVELDASGALAIWAVGDSSLLSFHLNYPRALRLR